jgi:hypothetical protein
MGTAIRNKIKRLEYIRNNVKKETSKILQNHEREIINLNYAQMRDGYGSDNKDLFNVRPEYDGVYAPEYKKQGLYDFFETGEFKRGLFATVKDGNIIVDSRGKGSGEKLLFFNSYVNLFGLNDDSKAKLRRIIENEIRDFIKRKI